MDLRRAFLPPARRWLARREAIGASVLAGTRCPRCRGAKTSGEPVCVDCAAPGRGGP